jgi:hypothetical protein
MRGLRALFSVLLLGCSTPADSPGDATERSANVDASPTNQPVVDARLRDGGDLFSGVSVRMWLPLADGSSSVGTVTLAAWSFGPILETQRQELLAAVVLETSTGELLGPVPTTSRVELHNGVAQWWTFELDVSSFADAWIHVRVTPPKYAAMVGLANVVALDEGRYLARYFTGSDPRLLSMNVCAKNGKHAFVLRLSEDAGASGTETDGVALTSSSRGPLPCTGYLLPRELYVLCGGVVETEPLELEIRPGVVGAERHVHTFTIAELPASRSEPTCRELRVW